jgi:hypothetical protein
MSSECGSELQPPTGQGMYERGQPWVNYIDRGTVLIRPPELSGNLASRVIS